MKNTMLNRILMIGAGTLALLLTAVSDAPAQNADAPGEDGTYAFGPPLRNGILFAYKYTERVKTWIADKRGSVQDSSERILTYYITQRQTDAEVGGGARVIEANIDSMRLDYRGPEGDAKFNTQSMDDVNNVELLRHRAVLVPSTLVSSLARFTISPYGSLVGVESKAFLSIREQGEDPMLDDFTYKRIDQMITDEYLSTVFLPWRNVVPYGHTLKYGRETRIPFIGALDRIVFVDSAAVTLKRGEKDPLKPRLEFRATVSDPKTEWITLEGRDNPILLKNCNAVITGMYDLDRDGVVLSGVSTANGTAVGSARGQEMTARFEHQTFVELMWMTASPIN